MVGLHQPDDAAVYRLNADQAIVQTLDFFAPTVDDPFQYGQIAAANALNDIYAMGADVLFALNIAAFPDDLPVETIVAVLEGGASKVREAGGAVAGGTRSSIESPSTASASPGSYTRTPCSATAARSPATPSC